MTRPAVDSMNPTRQTILGMEVDTVSTEDVLLRVFEWAQSESGKYICVSNVHQCMETFDDPGFRNVVNSADLVIPDSQVLGFAQGFLGYGRSREIVRGVDLMGRLCEEAASRHVPIAIYGGSEASLPLLVQALRVRYPSINIACAISPPFRELSRNELDSHASDIRKSGARLLFVGIGCPKQEKWMHDQARKLPVVMIGVGAAFDFIAGVTRPSPRWIHRLGLEWLYRLLIEPRRLWKRYLKHNPRFVYHLIRQKLGRQYPLTSESARQRA